MPTTERAIWLAEHLTKLLSEGEFHPTKFPSDNRQVLVAPPQGEQANPSTNLDLNQLPRTWIALGRSFRYLSVQDSSHKQATHQTKHSLNS